MKTRKTLTSDTFHAVYVESEIKWVFATTKSFAVWTMNFSLGRHFEVRITSFKIISITQLL